MRKTLGRKIIPKEGMFIPQYLQPLENVRVNVTFSYSCGYCFIHIPVIDRNKNMPKYAPRKFSTVPYLFAWKMKTPLVVLFVLLVWGSCVVWGGGWKVREVQEDDPAPNPKSVVLFGPAR
jgi:hypothetical protein